MKRVLSILLVVIFAITLFEGCSQQPSGAQTAEQVKQSDATKVDAKQQETKQAETKQADSVKKTGEKAVQNATFSAPKVKKDGKLKIGYLVTELTNESSQRNWQQIQNECKSRGWDLIQDTNATNEAEKTRNAFQRIMSQNPDAIVFSYLDIPPVADLIVEARNKGIGVYSIGADMTPGLIVNIADNAGTIGAKMAEYAINRMNGKGKNIGVIDLWMPRGFRRDIVAASLFENGQWDFGKVEHHKLTPEGYTDELFKVTSNWLTKYGKDLSYVWTCWDLGGITAARAMAEKGFTKNDMFTVGIDGGSLPWAIIREGKIPFVASLAEPFEYQVHTVMEAVKQLQIDGLKPGDKGCSVPVNGNITTDYMTVIIDDTNVPAVGTNIHSVFNYYGGKADDKSAWYNQGEPFVVKSADTNEAKK